MLSLSDEQRLLLETVDELAKNEFREDAYTWDRETPWANIELLADRGFLGINFDEEYGGGGMTELEAMLMNEVIGRVCPDTARFLNSQHMVAPRTLAMFGTEAAKETYLPPVIEGEDCIAIAMSEPEAGSDVKSMTSTIEDDGGELVLNGEKTWVSYVEDASSAVFWVHFDEGLGTAIVDLDAPGIDIANHFENMAGHTQTQIFMNDVPVPEENVITRGGDGFKEMLKGLNWERLSAITTANSIAESALNMALEYAGEREQFGQAIGEFQGIEWKLADMVLKLQASKALTYQTATQAVAEDRVPDPLNTSIANLYSGVVANEIVSEALQIHGANGYQKGHPIEYLFRLVRSYRIAGGTDEIQRNTIASLLKKNGVPALLDDY